MKVNRRNNEWASFIPNGPVNESIAMWQNDQPSRVQTCASPSSLLDCPRVVWLRKHGVAPTNQLGWGQKQRFMLGRITENMIATQLKDSGKLLWHWKDDYDGESRKFYHGEDEDRLCGTPDLLLRLHKIAISDSKTSRSDSFAYVPVEPKELWEDPYWYKYKLQLTAYYMLCHWNTDWFERRNLPLPEICHLFSYALDDGIVRRDLTWTPEEDDIKTVVSLTRRWNRAYNSETMPECTCKDDNSVKFCPYGTKEKDDDKICSQCCDTALGDSVDENA